MKGYTWVMPQSDAGVVAALQSQPLFVSVACCARVADIEKHANNLKLKQLEIDTGHVDLPVSGWKAFTVRTLMVHMCWVQTAVAAGPEFQNYAGGSA